MTDQPLPAILEYLPYRRRDRHRGDDAVTHPALAAEGYVCVRVDMRGAGDSDGLMFDEYTPAEWRDAVDVIDWIAAQPWCDGNLGIDRALLERLQRVAGRGTVAGAAEGDCHHLCFGRPLRRRHALHGR